MRAKTPAILVPAAAILMLASTRPAFAQQKISSIDRDRAEEMLKMVHDDIKKHYYDATYHGQNLDGIEKTYADRIKDAQSLGAAFTDIAAYVSNLHDSHTYFVPPSRSYLFDYGFRFQVIGDRAFITEVRPGSDAASKMRPGDEILRIGTFAVNRQDYHDLSYYLYQLAPQPGLSLDLRDPSGKERQEAVKTKIITEKRVVDLTFSGSGMDIWQLIRQQEASEHLLRQRWVELDDVMIWKMPEFEMTDSQVDEIFDKANKHRALILDLRGNPGGSVSTLERMIGNVFDHDVTVSTRVARKPEKPQLAKARHGKTFTGKIIVLVDSRSASAAELFSRMMQLEHRGTVVGDQSAGAVMESLYYGEQMGADTQVFYGASITDANLIMSDGKSLENVGVTPDVVVLPNGADLAAGSDPALAKAAELAGIKLNPGAAGKLFPFEWAPLSTE